jgi:putative nucleotidyltransferase with HDIG domain
MAELDEIVQHNDQSPYAGRWIACIGDQIIGQGGTPAQALHAAQASRFKEIPQISYVPPTQPLLVHPILEKLAALFPPDFPIYIVGGAVRDALVQRPISELDFIVPDNAIKHARNIANHLEGAFYVLDSVRDYGRVLVPQPHGQPLILDFAPQQGADLELDLKSRDFTINAMAAGITPPYPRYDPLGGANDLLEKKLRACSPTAINNDPIRILRGIRFAVNYGVHTDKETKSLMRAAVDLLPNVSAERIRDELFKLLSSRKPEAATQVLDVLGGLQHVLPELVDLKDVKQSPPHIYDAWKHTLEVVRQLGLILNVLSSSYDPDSISNLYMGVVSLQLARYRKPLTNHLEKNLVQSRPTSALNVLGALYHDIGKPHCQEEDEAGEIHFLNHEVVGAKLAARRAADLQLSNDEIKHLEILVRNHMRPLWLAQTGKPPSRRAKYRFFRDTQDAGIDICLLSLADTLGTYGHTLPPDTWKRHVDVVRSLMEAWWELKDEQISPTALIDGNDLMNKFNLKPGPLIGRLLSGIQEAQATGVVKNSRQAYEYANRLLQEEKDLQ